MDQATRPSQPAAWVKAKVKAKIEVQHQKILKPWNPGTRTLETQKNVHAKQLHKEGSGNGKIRK